MENLKKYLVLASAVLILAGCIQGGAPAQTTPPAVTLSGAALFDKHCRQCHGDPDKGIENNGPPLAARLPDGSIPEHLTAEEMVEHAMVKPVGFMATLLPTGVVGITKEEVEAIADYVHGIDRPKEWIGVHASEEKADTATSWKKFRGELPKEEGMEH